MSRVLIEEYLALLDAAFREPPSPDGDTPSVLGNLQSVPLEAYAWVPPRGARTIVDLLIHLGMTRLAYDDHAFRGGKLRWGVPPLAPPRGEAAEPGRLVEWLESAQSRLLESVAALSDSDLDTPRKTHWGAEMETRQIVAGMVRHDHYHAGEINHIRSLHAGDDRWAWEPR
jgi:uncharacterized damage-inducible protein DinB